MTTEEKISQIVFASENAEKINAETFEGLCEEAQCNVIYACPEKIALFENPSKEMQLLALSREMDAKAAAYDYYDHMQAPWNHKGIIGLIKNPCQTAQLMAVRISPEDALKNIADPSDAVVSLAVSLDGESIKYVKDPDEKTQLAAVENNPDAIAHIKNPNERIQLAAVHRNGNAVRFIHAPGKEVRYAAVMNAGCSIEYIPDAGEELEKLAVRQNGSSIKFIKNPSVELQVLSVAQDPANILLIKNPDRTAEKIAVKADPKVIIKMRSPSEDAIVLAVSGDPSIIKELKTDSKKVLLAAVAADGRIINDIDNPDRDIQETAVRSILAERECDIDYSQYFYKGMIRNKLDADLRVQTDEYMKCAKESAIDRLEDLGMVYTFPGMTVFVDSIPGNKEALRLFKAANINKNSILCVSPVKNSKDRFLVRNHRGEIICGGGDHSYLPARGSYEKTIGDISEYLSKRAEKAVPPKMAEAAWFREKISVMNSALREYAADCGREHRQEKTAEPGRD